MEMILLWLSTSITSICMEIANELRMYKDLADAGYKIDIKKLGELREQLNPDAPKIDFLSLLIPILNILLVLKRTEEYNNARSMILNELSTMDLLEEMSEIEKEEYSKNPTGLNAFIVQTKMEIRLAKAKKIIINNENEKSELFYEVGNTINDITILKVTGDAAKLTLEEQKEKITNSIMKFLSEIVDEVFNEINDPNEQNSNETIELNDNKPIDAKQETNDNERSEEKEKSISERKQALEKYKNELLEGIKNAKNNPNSKPPTLSRKK